jgi:hypothetical protein
MTSLALTPHKFVLPQHVTVATTSTRCAQCNFTSRAKVHTSFVETVTEQQAHEMRPDVQARIEASTKEVLQQNIESLERASFTLLNNDLPSHDTMPEGYSDDGCASGTVSGSYGQPERPGYIGRLNDPEQEGVNRAALLRMGCSEAQAKELAGREFSALPKWLRDRIKKRFKAPQSEPTKLRPAAGQLAFYLDPHRFRPMMVQVKGAPDQPVPLFLTKKHGLEKSIAMVREGRSN